MNDEELAQRVRRLETPVEPNPAFAESLFSALRSQALGRPSGARRSQPLFAIAGLAAVLVVAVVAGTMAIKLLDGRPQEPGSGPVATPTSPRPVATPTSRPTLLPTGTPAGGSEVADAFARPFEYTIPIESGLGLAQATFTMYAFTDGSDEPYPGYGYGTDVPGVRGVTVSFSTAPTTHSQTARAIEPLGLDTFLTDLHRNPTLKVGGEIATDLAGIPARQADVAPSFPAGGPAYPDIHMGSDVLALGFPSRLIVARSGEGVIVVHIWAATDEDLATWLPLATEFVDSITFVSENALASPGSSSVRPTGELSPTPIRTLTVPVPPNFTDMEAGRYSLNRQYLAVDWPASVILDVPSGWQMRTASRGGGLVKYEPMTAPGTVDTLGELSLWSVATLPSEVCADFTGDIDDLELPLGPAVEDFVQALRNRPALIVTEQAPVVVDGYVGTSVQFTTAVDLDCPVQPGEQPTLQLWTAPRAPLHDIWTAYVPQYAYHRVHVLDVDGTRYVIYTGFETRQLDEEIQAMVESIDIVP